MNTIGSYLFRLIRQFVYAHSTDDYDGGYVSSSHCQKGPLHFRDEDAYAYGVETIHVTLELKYLEVSLSISDISDYKLHFRIYRLNPSVPF